MPRRSWTIKPPRGVLLDLSHPLAAGLVAAWTMDDGTGRAFDRVRSAHAFPGVFPPIPVDTPFGRSLFFSNQNLRIDPASTSALDMSRNFTILAWVRPDPTASAIRGIYSQGRDGAYLRLNNAGPKLEFIDSSVALVLTGTANVSDTSRVYQLGATVSADATATVTLWVDGREDASTSTTRAFTNGSLYHYIGSDHNDNERFFGTIVAIYIYARALSAAEIRSLYQNPWQIFRPQGPAWGVAAIGGGPVSISGTDTATVSITESGAVSAQAAASDTATVSLTDTATVDAIAIATDTTAVSTTESGSVAVDVQSTDTLSVSTSESGVVSAQIAGTETAAVSTSETGNVSAVSQKAGTDTITVSTSESGSVQAVQAKSGTDTIALSTSETGAVASDVAGTDTTTISASEAATIAAAATSSDIVTVGTSEMAVVAAAVAAGDTATISLMDSGAVAVEIASAQTVIVSLSESGSVTDLGDIVVPYATATISDADTTATISGAHVGASIRR